MNTRFAALLCTISLCLLVYNIADIRTSDAGKVMLKASGGSTTTTEPASTTTTTATCSTVEDSDDTPRGTPADVAVAAGASYTYSASRFAVDSTYDICAIELSLQKVVGDSTPTWEIRAEIWSDDSGNGRPNAMLTNGSSSTLGPSDLDTSYAWETFTFATPPTLSSGTTYWMVVHATSAGDGGDYVQIQVGNNFTDQERGDETPTWTDDGSELFMYKTYK